MAIGLCPDCGSVIALNFPLHDCRPTPRTRRAFDANPPEGIARCSKSITLRDKSRAQCMRRAVRNGMCAQHAKMAEHFVDRWVDVNGKSTGMYGSPASSHTPRGKDNG